MRWISSMNSTSPSVRLVSSAARSPARSIAGPLVIRIGVPSSRGDDHREAGLAQAGRAGQQHVVRRPAAPQRALEDELQLLAHLRLPDELGRAAWAAARPRHSSSSSAMRPPRSTEVLGRRSVIGSRPQQLDARAQQARRRPARRPVASSATTSIASAASLPAKPRPASAWPSWSRHGATGVDAAAGSDRRLAAVDRADPVAQLEHDAARRPCGRCRAPGSAR